MAFVERVRLLESGNLHIIDVKDTDFGQYTCTASNHITAEVIESQRILKLVVKTPPSKSRPSVLAWTPEERYITQIGALSFDTNRRRKHSYFLFFSLLKIGRSKRNIGMCCYGMASTFSEVDAVRQPTSSVGPLLPAGGWGHGPD